MKDRPESKSGRDELDAPPAPLVRMFCLSSVLLILFIGLSFVVSLVGIGRNFYNLSGGQLFLGLCFLLLLVGLCVWTRLSFERLGDATFLLIVCLAAFVARALVVLCNLGYLGVGDGPLLHSFVVRLAQDGLNARNLSSLSRIYDYQIWLSRSFPLFLPLRWLFGDGDLVAVRIMNCCVSTAIVAMTFVLGRHFFSSMTCRYASLLMAAFPLYVLDVLNYTPQASGTLLFMLCIWVLLEFMSSGGKAVVWSGLLFGLLLFLVRIQRGLDLLVLPLALLLIILLGWIRSPGKRWQSVCGVVLVSLTIYLPASIAFGDWIVRHDANEIRSYALGFMARGWNPVTLGEYFNRYQEIDSATPREEKAQSLGGLIASQVTYRPLFTLGVLPWVKIAKFFLVGYASETEEGVSVGVPSFWAGAIMALRVSFAPLLLALVLVGVWLQARTLGFDPWFFYLGLIPIAACLATVFFGETSPRYSYFVHFALALIAGRTLSERGGGRLPACGDCRVLPSLGTAAVLYVLTAGLVYGGVAYFGRPLLFQRMDSTASTRASG